MDVSRAIETLDGARVSREAPLTSTRRWGTFGAMPGIPELLIILVIAVVIFGATRLPQIGKGLGEGIRNFRSATKDPPEIDSPKIEVGPKPENETKD